MNVSKVHHKPSLEEFAIVTKGQNFWWASWYASVLGYKSLRTFLPVIKKAKKACMVLGIDFESNFINEKNGAKEDIKLSKFACFVVALQADARKPIVKRARSYFLNELEEVNILLDNEEYMNRRIGRNELSNLNKILISSGRRAKVKDFRYFMNEGYMGLYNSTLADLRQARGVPANADLFDYAGTTELTANIFRLSLTSERLKRLRNPSEASAAREHWKIGMQIRSMIKENTGLYPEQLPLKQNLRNLQKKLKSAQKLLNKEVSTPK